MSQNRAMLRILTIASGFTAITAALLFFQPGAGQNRDGAPRQSAHMAGLPTANPDTQQVQVSRAQAGLDLLATSGATVPVAASAPARQDGRPNHDPLGTTLELAPTRPAQSDELRDLTASVLSNLGAAPAKPPSTNSVATESDTFRTLTSGVLDSLRSANSPLTVPATDPQGRLEALVAQAVRQGQSDAYLDAILNEAAETGSIDVPKSLLTDQGRVDTSTLVATLVAQSQPGGDKPVASEHANVGGAGVEVRVVQRAGKTEHYSFYTVQPGDSLGAIAQKFYGDARFYPTIFDANRQLLASPDRIRAGQRLTIPKLNTT